MTVELITAGETDSRAAQSCADETDAWRDLRRLSGELAASGDHEAALDLAAKALALAPAQEWEAALHFGALRNHLERHEQALAPLMRAARLNPAIAETFQQLAWASERLGRPASAAPLALRAHELDPGAPERLVYAAHLMAVAGRLREAAALLGGSPAHAKIRESLLARLIEAGDTAAAFELFEALRADGGCDAQSFVGMAYLAGARGERELAVALIEAAAADQPDNVEQLRHAVTIFLEAGQASKALAAAGRLLHLSPCEPEYASCMAHVLRVCDGPARVETSPILLAKRNAGPPPPVRAPGNAALTQARVIWALMMRETLTRYGDSRLGYAWAVGELAIHIGVLALVFPFTMHGRPPIGDSFFFFYFTGLVPYLLFSHVSGQVGHGIQQNRDLLQLPQVANFDVLLARGLLEFATLFLVALIFIAGFLAFGVDALPKRPDSALFASFSLWLLAVGIGAINAVAAAYTRAFEHAWQILLRLLYFASGIFYTPGMMPERVREILAWNPVLHGVDWFRTAFFSTYEPEWLARSYLLRAGVLALFVGLALLAGFRKALQASA